MSTTGGTTGVVTPLNPLTPVANLGNQYINGMRLTYLTTTTFSVGIGACRDASGLTDIVMGTSIYSYANESSEYVTPLPVAAVANLAVSGAGGIDVGTVTASKNYYVYAIGDSRGFKTASVVLSLTAPVAGVNTGGAIPTAVTLPVGPVMPMGYDCWRYIGSVAVNASSHVSVFKQTGAQALRTMWFDSGTLSETTVGLAIPSSATGASHNTFATIGVLTTLIPQTALEVMVYSTLLANAAGDALWLAPYGATGAYTGYASSAAAQGGQLLRVPCALNGAGTPIMEVDYATSSATATVGFTLPGYIDQL